MMGVCYIGGLLIFRLVIVLLEMTSLKFRCMRDRYARNARGVRWPAKGS